MSVLNIQQYLHVALTMYNVDRRLLTKNRNLKTEQTSLTERLLHVKRERYLEKIKNKSFIQISL